MRDAGAVARSQGFPHYVLDYEDRFRAEVIDTFVAEYLAGRTPQPLRGLQRQAQVRPAAPGRPEHGMRQARHRPLCPAGGRRRRDRPLFKARDRFKDQTYFLYRLTQPQLTRLLFPLGELDKAEVRKESQGMGLAHRRQSRKHGHLLRAARRLRPGPQGLRAPKPAAGAHRGRDRGCWAGTKGWPSYTVGQRRGLKVSGAEASLCPCPGPRATTRSWSGRKRAC